MSHIVESCPLTKLNGGLSRLHSADEDAVSWLTSLWFMTRRREEEVNVKPWLRLGRSCPVTVGGGRRQVTLLSSGL